MQDSNNLRVSKQAHRLALRVYRHTADFPDSERFGLTSQMRRGSVSIVSNIAEGCGRRTNRALLACLYVASGAASELAAQHEIATDLRFGNPKSADALREEIRIVARMLARLISFHRKNPDRRGKEQGEE